MAKEDLQRLYLQRNTPYIPPFYKLDLDNDSDILSWIEDTDNALSSYYQPLFSEQKNNLKIFLSTGINPNFFSPLVAVYLQQGLIMDEPDDIYINEMYLLVREQVSTIVSNELTAQVLPNNDDYKDKVAAKIVKMWLDSMSYDMDIDIKRIQWELQKKIFGECFVIPKWDYLMGDIHPMAKNLVDDDLPLVDEDDRPIRDRDGNPLKIDKYQRIGDIDLVNPLPFDVMIDPKHYYKDSNWFYWVDWKETCEVESEYDVKFSKDKKNPNLSKYDPNSGFDKGASEFTKVYNFYHRSHPLLPNGYHFVCTNEHVLEKKTMEGSTTLVNNRELPLVRFMDLDIGFGVRGNPILFRNTRNVVSGYNRLTNQIYKNLEAESPKVMVHETAGVDAQRMPNGVIVMEWRGNIKPTIETPTTNTTSIFKFREDLKKNIIELGGQTPMVRGDTPNAQLDSFIALQHFEDQRIQLAAPDIKNHIKCMEHLYRFLIVIARDHYDSDDQRLIKIIGRNNKFNLQYFDPDNLDKVYDVKITTTGNLANSKAARTQLIMTIKREFPEIITNEVFIDMLGLSSSDKFQNTITAAVNAAESENEDMLNGVPVPPPERYEDLITHWDTHRIPLQSREYKLAPPEIKELFEIHVTATEKLMYDQAAESDVFASRLAGLRQFPMFFSPLPNNDNPQEEEQAVEEARPLPESTSEQVIEVDREGEEGQPQPEQLPIQDREEAEALPEPT